MQTQLPPLIQSLGYPGNLRYLTKSLGIPEPRARQILHQQGITPDLADPVLRDIPKPLTTEEDHRIANYYWDNYPEGTPHKPHFLAVKTQLGISEESLRQALKRTGRTPRQVSQQQQRELRRQVIEFVEQHPTWTRQAIADALDMNKSTVSGWIRQAQNAA